MTSTTIKPEQSTQTKSEIPPATSTTVKPEVGVEAVSAEPNSEVHIPDIEPTPVPERMEVDDPNVPSVGVATGTAVNPDAQISDDDDLFGEKADSASGMSPPRY
jgi:hypothetical protein